MNIWHDLHFDKGVRVAVRVHGCQMGTAYDTNQQAALLRVIAEWHQDAATLGTQKTTVSDGAPVSIFDERTLWESCSRVNRLFKLQTKNKILSG